MPANASLSKLRLVQPPSACRPNDRDAAARGAQRGLPIFVQCGNRRFGDARVPNELGLCRAYAGRDVPAAAERHRCNQLPSRLILPRGYNGCSPLSCRHLSKLASCDGTHCLRPCPAGSMCTVGSIAPTRCRPGTFASLPGSSECRRCNPDSFAAHAGATTCAQCAPGNWCTASARVPCGSKTSSGSGAGCNESQCNVCAADSTAIAQAFQHRYTHAPVRRAILRRVPVDSTIKTFQLRSGYWRIHQNSTRDFDVRSPFRQCLVVGLRWQLPHWPMRRQSQRAALPRLYIGWSLLR